MTVIMQGTLALTVKSANWSFLRDAEVDFAKIVPGSALENKRLADYNKAKRMPAP